MEYWDIYDINKKKTGKTTPRIGYKLDKGEYHIVASAIIINSKGQLLISKRAEYKPHGLKWEINGGSVVVGETSLEGILREVREELGIDFQEKDATLFKTIRRDDPPADFKDLWLFKKDIDIKKEVTFPDGESIEAKWVTVNEYKKLIDEKVLIGSKDFSPEDFQEIIKKFC